MHIVQLTAENVKRLHAVTIKPDGSVVQITGRNGQGKTSVLDAITYALGGKSVQPSRPIRDGAESASVIVDLGDLVVKRTWTANDRTYLSVESRNGAKFSSPQAVLDKLVGELTFDPLAFSRMAPAQQVATLKNVAGLDFETIDGSRDDAYTERTAINRDLKSAQAQLDAIPAVEAPDHEVSIADLAKQQSDAMATIRANESLRSQVDSFRQQIEASEDRIADLARQMNAEEERQALLRETLASVEYKVASAVTPDVAALTKALESAEETNRRVRQKAQRHGYEKRVIELIDKADALTRCIDTLDEKKRSLLRNAKLPVQGLSFTPDGVTFNEVPFQQASAAEQLRISVAMGLALNPKLRVMLIRDGSVLDRQSLQLLAELAEQSQAQVWIERVSDGEPVGVVIEDGYVAAPAVADPAAALI